MKKLLAVIAVLSLIAGTAYAAALDDGLTREVWAQNKSRAVATDGSAAIKIWCLSGGAARPAIGVSSSTSLIIYENVTARTGHTIDTGSSSYDTVGEVVDFINTNLSSDSSVKIYASVGSDARRSSSTRILEAADHINAGTDQDSSTAIAYLSTNYRLSAGVEGKANKYNRIKSFDAQLPDGGVTNGVTYTVYDGNTAVWTKYVPAENLRTVTAIMASPNTVAFPATKGISSTMGNSIMVEAVLDGGSSNTTAAEKSQTNISIVYDQF